jgi:hypothetical protein
MANYNCSHIHLLTLPEALTKEYNDIANAFYRHQLLRKPITFGSLLLISLSTIGG